MTQDFILVSEEKRPLIFYENNSEGRAQEAAALLSGTIERITGKAPEIISYSSKDAITSYSPIIIIGYCNTGDGGQIVKIETEDGIVRLSGNLPHKGALKMGREADWINRHTHLEDESADGAYYAVLTFIRKYLEAETLFPGEDGYAYEKKTEIRIPCGVNFTYRPKLLMRKLRNCFSARNRNAEGLEKIKVPSETVGKLEEASRQWFRENFLGFGADLRFTHNFTSYWDKYKDVHPEWFALQESGSRDQSRDPSDRARLCKSNEKLIEHIAGEIIGYFKKDPHSSSYSISLNDGGFHNRFCVCEKCRALDPEDAPEINYGGRNVKSLSDRIFSFYSRIAEIVGEKYPDKLLGAYAYSLYNTPPMRIKKLPENLLLGIVRLNYMNDESRREELATINEWSKKVKHFFVRPNALNAFHAFPAFYGHKLAEDVRFCVERGCLGFDWDCNEGHWSVNGINVWMLAQLMWEPDASIDGLLERYCKLGFGKASGPVLEYINLTKRVADEFAASCKWVNWMLNLPELAAVYTDEWFDEAEGLLGKAFGMAGGNAGAKARIEFLKSGVAVSRIRRDYILSAVEKTTEGKPEFRIENEHLDGTSVAVMKSLDAKIALRRDEIYKAAAGTYAFNVGALAWRNL